MKKKVLSLVLVSVILLSVLTVGAATTILYGDANGDGVLNNRDLVLLQRYLNGWDVQLGPDATTTTTTTTQTPALTFPAAETLSVADASALGLSMPEDTYSDAKYYVSGTIAEMLNTVQGNMVIRDNYGNTLTIYGAYSADGKYTFDRLLVLPKEGDTITLYGAIGCHNGVAQMRYGWVKAHNGKQPEVYVPSAWPTQTNAQTNAQTTTNVTQTTNTTITVTPDALLEQVPEKLNGQKIKMLIWWNAGAEDTQKVADFQAQTGIQVAFETATMDRYQSNLSAKIMSGSPPQTAAIINEWYPQPITRGLMQPIKNTGWDYTNKTDDIYALSLMEQFSYKGEMYGVALKGSNRSTFEVMFFNKDMLAANGVKEDPYQLWKKGQWNWDTCLEIAKDCTVAKNDTYGLTLIGQYYWMLSAGQDFVLSDINGLQNNIMSTKLLDTWTHAWDMINTHKVIPTNFTQMPQLFFNEQVAMFGAGSYYMQAEASHSNYVPQNAKFNWGVVPFPSPTGQSAVAACEGTVWGFPTKVTGDKLQAAMWWLRYYLDDATYASRDLYANEQCWEVMDWLWNQQIQSYNSVGVITYGGSYTAWSIQFSVIDEAATKDAVKTNLEQWYAVIDANIQCIENEL